VLGEKPLEWLGGLPERFRIAIAHLPRAAAAEVSTTEGEPADEINGPTHWSAAWAAPGFGFKGTDFP
jgi:hypothetical protein